MPHLGRQHGWRRFVPPRLNHALDRRDWRKKWGHGGYSRMFSAHGETPPELAEAVDMGWLPPGGWTLDIGCGDGWLSAWLAHRGYRVVGADYAPEAVERARSEHGEVPGGLEWEVVDFVAAPPTRRGFDGLYDRACMGHIDPQLWPDYARVIHACAGPAARFLLVLGPYENHRQAAEMAVEARRALTGFDQERAEEILIRRAYRGGGGDQLRPAMALWLSRRR